MKIVISRKNTYR